MACHAVAEQAILRRFQEGFPQWQGPSMVGMLQTLGKTNSYEIHIWPPGVLPDQDAELLAVTRAQVGYFHALAQGSKAVVGARGALSILG